METTSSDTSAINQAHQLAVQQLYENEKLSNAMTDEPAKVLLQWGEAQLRDLTDRDPAALDAVMNELQRTMRTINRFIEQQAELTEMETVQRLIKLVEQAMQLADKRSLAQRPSLQNEI